MTRFQGDPNQHFRRLCKLVVLLEQIRIRFSQRTDLWSAVV